MGVTETERGLAEPILVDGSAVTQPISGGVHLVDGTTGTSAGISARAQTPTGNALQVQIGPGDPISNIPVTIDFPHHQIHEGESHMWWWYGSLNGTKDIRISVPAFAAQRGPHLVPEIISDATQTTIAFYEDTTWTAVGTESLAKYNRNRNLRDVAAATRVFVTGTTTLTPNTLGTQLYAGYLASSNKAINMTDRGISEWILRSGTEYLLRVVTAAVGNVLIRLDWYEDLGV